MPRTAVQSRLGNLKQENPMNVNHYIGFDVHKKSISYCVKTADGTIVEEGMLRATHLALTGVGREAAGAVARRDGSNAVQRMDLRYVETLRCRVANGTSGDDEGDRRIQEEERQAGRAENRGPGALQSVASMLRGAEGNPRAAADAALPQPSGGAGGAHEEQDERAAHGGGSRVQQTASAREGILPRIAGHHRRSAGIGKGSVASESRSAGDVSDDA